MVEKAKSQTVWEELQFQNALMETQREASLEGMLVVDEAGRWVSYNRRFIDMWGISPEIEKQGYSESALRSVMDKLVDPAAFQARVKYLYEHRDEKSQEEIALCDGRIFERYSAPVLSPEGKYYGRIWYYRDISERVQMAEALRISEEKLRLLYEESPLGMVLCGMDGSLLQANEAYLDIIGYTREEIKGMTYWDITPRQYDEAAQGVLQSLTSQGRFGPYEKEYVRKDGSLVEVVLHGVVVKYADGEDYMWCIIENVTERKLIEEKLHQAQKMEAIGQLSAGISHNFNNMLMAIGGNLQLAMKNAPYYLKFLLENADESAKQAAEMISQLMAYARQGRQPELKPLDIVPLIDDTVQICRRTFDRKIAVEVRTRGDIPPALGDDNQLGQILLNLCLNARDALQVQDHADPVIRIEVGTVAAEDLQLPEGAEPIEHIQIIVRDNGIGMDESTRQRVFDPFFTTKPMGQGTGLGLSTVLGIIEQHKGWITCESQPREGTAFKIYLPVQVLEVERPSAERLGKIRYGEETILLVEDELKVRQVVVPILESYGYRVLEAADGQEGFNQYRLHADEIDLVLLDLNMPRMTGQEVLNALQSLNPQVKVAIFTGLSLTKEDFPGIAGIIYKPIDLKRLVRDVQEALGV